MRYIVTVFLLVAIASCVTADDLLVKVYVNGKAQSYDPSARVRNGTTYVPLRQGAESLGFSVKWMAEQNMAQICTESACMMIPKNDGIIVDSRLFLPLRKMAEAFGADVKWDAAKKAVIINRTAKKQTFG